MRSIAEGFTDTVLILAVNRKASFQYSSTTSSLIGLPRGMSLGGGTRHDLRENFHTSRYTTVWKGNMVTLQQQIAEKFLAGLAASKDVDIERIEQLRRLLADTKKPKPEEFVRIFSLTAGDDLK